MDRRKLELLAPARDLRCGLAAIEHGADAVYIGGPQFSARAAAANSLQDIEKLVAAAHVFHARVYVALNTLFDDRQIDRAALLARQLHDIGVDALIVQDLGLLECDLPPIPLHASTQMNNRVVDKVRFLEGVGFEQVVLARELSLDQIRAIRQATAVTLECFVHGALCVSYSGQCYISEVMAGRSANRGECAQFCRHRYTLRDRDGKILARDRFLLSLKDLDLSGRLADLIAAGVDSFKIEGRLKDEGYVKNVTSLYRQALDRLIDGDDRLARASSGRCSFIFTPDAARSFNRGRTEYFLDGGRRSPAAIDSPKSIGRKLGSVVALHRNSFTVETKERLTNGDGLCYFDTDGNLVGIRANRVDGRRIFIKDARCPPVGTIIYRNADTSFVRMLEQSGQCRKIAVRLALAQTADGLQLTIMDEDGLQSRSIMEIAGEAARNPGEAARLAERQLMKSGATIFLVEEVDVTIGPEVHYPAAAYNELRRTALAAHARLRLEKYAPLRVERPAQGRHPWPGDELSYFDNIANGRAEHFIVRHGGRIVDSNLLRAAATDWCALMTCRYCVRMQLGLCPRESGHSRGNAEPLFLADNSGTFQLSFDCRRCEMIVRKAKGEER